MNTATAAIPTQTTNDRFPPQIRYIVGNEACERFSYYGMRGILVVFMTTHLALKAADAKAIYHLFASACYLLPLLGAYLADRVFGKYRTILYLSIIYCLGHLTLAIWENEQGLYWGLALIALGSGGIKPCVSAHVGDQFNESNKHLLQRVFDIFYWSINFGAFFSTLLIPVVLSKYGPSWAFGIPGILMAIATYVFWLGRKHYVHVPPAPRTKGNAGFMEILLYALRHFSQRQPGQTLLDVARARFSAAEVDAAKAAASIFKVFATVSIFWALFDQSGSSWVLQAEKMDLNFMGLKLEPSQIQALNPIMVMVLIPIFTYGIYPLVEKLGLRLTPLRKMSTGMVLAALSFVFVGVLQTWIDAGARVSVAWQFVPYLIITCSEVMISITGLEFAYTQAPRSMKSTIMSFWLLTVFAGNLLDAYVAKMNVFDGATQFFFFAGLMFAVSIIFIFSAIRYQVRDYIEEGNATGELQAATVGSPAPVATLSNG
jgi:POT family proton-dependent oligopeptide transporter